MNIGEITNVLVAVQIVLTVLVGAFAFYMRATFVPRREFAEHAEDVGKRLTTHSERLVVGETRFARLEDRIATLPTASEVNSLKVAIERLAGDVRALNEKIEGFEDLHHALRRQVEVMDEFLRAHK